MRHRVSAVATTMAVAASAALAGCTSPDAHNQSLTFSSPVSSTPAGSGQAASSPALTASVQPAVHAHIDYENWLVTHLRAPATPDPNALAKVATGAALTAAVQEVQQAHSQGLVYKGTPGAVQISVGSVTSTTVTMTDCHSAGTFLPYDIHTGKAISTSPGIHPTSITVTLSQPLGWRVSSATVDPNKTCPEA